jgi:hypothetical protein
MRSVISALLVPLALGFALACESDPDEEPNDPGTPGVALLSPTEHLLRVTMALAGERPKPEELDAVRADPNALNAITDRYLGGEGFGEMVRDLYNEALQVRVPAAIYPAGFGATGALSGRDVQDINVSVTEAPLKLIERVVMRDLPLTEIVTADYTVADATVAQVWGLTRAGDAEWDVAHYRDGREHAGILSDSMVFTRHSTTLSNKNRGRAAAISRGLLCYDFLTRGIEVDASINLADPEEVANAVQKNTACAGCHQTLDPLAAFFGSFHPIYVPSQVESYPYPFYTPGLSQLFTVGEPGYFGYSGRSLRDLGKMIAEDPRFSLCAAKRFYAYFHQVSLSDVPRERAAELQAVLTQRYSAKDLARAIVLADDFRVSHAETDDATLNGTRALDRRFLLKARPWQLARTIEGLTGFRWEAYLNANLGYGTVGRLDMMTDSLFGYNVLAGGIDSVNVTLPANTMTASASLVLRGLAARAVEHVVDADLEFASSAKLLRVVREQDVDEAKVRAQLVELELRLFGVVTTSDSPQVTSGWELFRDALREPGGTARRAWRTTLFALLQDPRLLYY